MLEVLNKKNLLVLAPVLIATVFLTPEVLSADKAWETAGHFQVSPGTAQIILLQQQNVDLAVQVQLEGSTLYEQDGPDQNFGTEVVVLDNPTELPAFFNLAVKPVRASLNTNPEYTITAISHPTDAQKNTALRLSQLSQQWFAGVGFAGLQGEQLLNTLGSAIDKDDRLQMLSVIAYVNLLVGCGEIGKAVDFFQNYPEQEYGISGDTFTSEKLYLRWLKADILWQSLHLEQAFAEIKWATQQIASEEWKLQGSESIRRWLDVHINATFGVIKIFLGRSAGDTELLISGGETIKATLQSLADSSDYSLRAHVSEYLAGYYMLTLDRTNGLTTQLFREAETLYEKTGDRLHIASIRNNQAYTELGRGNVGEALRLYLETLELQEESRHREGKAHVRARLGYLYFTLGDYRRAEIRYREAVAIYGELNLNRKLIHNQLELAEVLRVSGRMDEALAILKDIRTQHQQNLSIEDSLRLFRQIASNCLDKGDIAAAETVLGSLGDQGDLGKAEWQKLQDTTHLFYLLDLEVLRARISLFRGDIAAAQQRIAVALKTLGETDREPLQQLSLLYLQMQIYQREGAHRQFIDIGQRALSLIESVRSHIDFQTQGPAWSARTSYIKDLMISHLLSRYEETGDMESFRQAFAILQSVRGRNFREMRADTGRNAQALSEPQLKLQQASQDLIQALLLDQSTDALERNLAKAEEQYQIAFKQQESLRLEQTILEVEQIQQLLAKDTQVRIFITGQLKSFSIILARDYFHLIPLPDEAELKQLVDKSLGELEPNHTDFVNLQTLARSLFPVDGEAPAFSRVLLEVDGPLSLVPFSVLISMQLGQLSSAVSVAAVPSLSGFFAMDDHSTATAFSSDRRELAIFSNPAFTLDAGATGENTFNQWRSQLGRLPFTQVEAESVLTYFEPDQYYSFSDSDATIKNLIDEYVRNTKVLHIAAHGFASSTDPLLIGLALANNTADNDPGLLTLDHIGSVKFNNELVIISACESANGQLLKGEGLMSIGRAFLASGASATISSLWPVSDRANSLFMKEFYFALTQLKLNPPDSLAYAQQRLKENRRYRHPYYWGSFVIQMAEDRSQATSSTSSGSSKPGA